MSDTLFSLADDTNDYNDVLRMLADVTYCQWESVKTVEAALIARFAANQEAESSTTNQK
ncbi:hypothetical protein [Raoultibacter massiliensis]|uniref:hypothetical protein n=1 Tax=Raoultibacter massiliensis TaxID=1852371 RepID=UPI003A91DB9E